MRRALLPLLVLPALLGAGRPAPMAHTQQPSTPEQAAPELRTAAGNRMQYLASRPTGWKAGQRWPVVVVIDAAATRIPRQSGCVRAGSRFVERPVDRELLEPLVVCDEDGSAHADSDIVAADHRAQGLIECSGGMMSETKVYLTRAGRLGEDEDLALESGLALIGFRDIPCLKDATDYESIFKVVRSSMPDAKSRAVGNRAGQLWSFVAMKRGDLAVMPRKLTSQIAIGRVTGPYEYQRVGPDLRHTRPVEWLRADVPRTAFEQDLLHSFGAFMTVCNISRNDAERRVMAVASGNDDPGPLLTLDRPRPAGADPQSSGAEGAPDLGQFAHDQIVGHIQARFAGHALASLVDAVLRADGWVTKASPPGADGGVDILGGRGPLGLDDPRLCVQVKSQNHAADVGVYRTLQGTMQTFKAEQGLLVCWGGFNKVVLSEARQGHFTVRLWDSRDLVEAIYRTYELLPAEIQAELPLKRVWMLVPEEIDT